MTLAPPVRTLVERAAVIWGVRRAAIVGQRRLPEICEARFAAYWCAHCVFDYSLARVGRVFRRHHTTVVSGISRCHQLREQDASYRKQTDELWEFAQELKGVK